MSDCKAFRAEIEEASGASALGPAASGHVRACAACGEALREREALRGLVRGLVRVEAPPDFEYRLRARMAAAKPRGGLTLMGRLRSPGLAWVAAAVCFVSVSAALYVRQSPKRAAAAAATVAASNALAHVKTVEAGRDGAGSSEAPGGVAFTRAVEHRDARSNAQVRLSVRAASAKRDAAQERWSDFFASTQRTDASVPGSFDLAAKSARVIKHLPEQGGEVARSQGIPLGTSAGTLRVVLRDERGARVPMRSVSFGSQEALLRETASRREPASDEEGVW
jgi:hypothetical protein